MISEENKKIIEKIIGDKISINVEMRNDGANISLNAETTERGFVCLGCGIIESLLRAAEEKYPEKADAIQMTFAVVASKYGDIVNGKRMGGYTSREETNQDTANTEMRGMRNAVTLYQRSLVV